MDPCLRQQKIPQNRIERKSHPFQLKVSIFVFSNEDVYEVNEFKTTHATYLYKDERIIEIFDFVRVIGSADNRKVIQSITMRYRKKRKTLLRKLIFYYDLFKSCY